MRLLSCFSLVVLSMLPVSYVKADEPLAAVPLYTETELLALINKNAHLARVKADDCQLVQDIEARANKMALPSYQFLYGDMLAYAVCVDRNVELGVYYMRQAANQGLAAALEQLGRYYDIGRLVQKDKAMAITYLREASAQGNLKAQLRLVKLFNDGFGSPRDYEDAYRWLFHAMVADKATHKKIERALSQLAQKMPGSVVERARLPM
ncbi:MULTISPECIES: tetratricopeptide repeat protein [unclassified Pseudoalteromonas]|uniref:tetratricopeptide repeat protein n=1 Tax=unclassified Pseudoalteromonas TaxID=194690 RepID=UPI000B3CFB35|nr:MULTISPECIES: tetratricopeptide repeat protein [unclassified Pseudoalteromonas]MDN3379366.1 tetratricopeptide repeat protein [Pseudoalteromonas sp. APC 3893]MDN3386540.1 tetratricopeptide repeat protein [Pseudoalteromonas sp. APC 4017]OUS71474.1 flagellar protein MotX [Pseudoalteromonas sp. A601]